MHARLHIAACLRGRILDEVKQALARCVRWRECVAASAVARNAGAGHRLFTTAIHVDGHASQTRAGIKCVELRKARATRRSRANLDRVGADVRVTIFDNGCVEIDAGVGISGCSNDQIIFHVGSDRAVRILPHCQIPTVAEITHVANHDTDFRARATGKSICGFPLVERVFLVGGVDCCVVGLRIRGGIGLHCPVGLHLRIGENQKSVRCGVGDHRLRRRRR